MSDLEARIAAVLQDHVPEPVYTSAEEGYMACYGCDWRGASYAGVYAHQASMLAPVVREAQAEAWESGHDDAQRDATRPVNVKAGRLRAMTANPYRSNDE